MKKKNYLDTLSDSNKPFIIYKSIKGFDLFTNFSEKIILNNKNIDRFLNKKYPNTLGYTLCSSCEKKREEKIIKEIAQSVADDLDFYDFEKGGKSNENN